MSVGGCSRGELTPVTPRTPDDADPDDDVYHRGPPKWRARMAKNLPPIPPAPRATEATSPRSSSRAFPSAPALERPKKSGRRSPASSPAPRERVAIVTPPSPPRGLGARASSPASSPRERVVTSPPRGLTIVRE